MTMPVLNVVCCNLTYNTHVLRPHQHAAQRLFDAISSFQAQRPDHIGSELISMDILAATSCIARHTCAFLRYANDQAPDIEETTTRARSATPTPSTPPKLAPNLLAKSLTTSRQQLAQQQQWSSNSQR